MDPNAVLDRIRVAVRGTDIEEAFQAFEALDNWLIQGGFLPNDWTDRKGDFSNG